MSLDEKADKLLSRRAVRVIRADRFSIAAVVRGEHGVYLVKVDFDRQRRRVDRSCDCPSWKTDCSHVRAVLKLWEPPDSIRKDEASEYQSSRYQRELDARS